MMGGDRGVGRNGFGDWFWQRASAIGLILLLPLPFALVLTVHGGGIDHQGMLALLDAWPVRILHTLLIALLLLHGFIGLKVIAQDYVHAIAWRVLLLGALQLLMAAFGVAWLAVVWAGGN